MSLKTFFSNVPLEFTFKRVNLPRGPGHHQHPQGAAVPPASAKEAAGQQKQAAAGTRGGIPPADVEFHWWTEAERRVNPYKVNLVIASYGGVAHVELGFDPYGLKGV